MTTYEIFAIVLEIIGLPITTGIFIITLLTFLEKRNGKRK